MSRTLDSCSSPAFTPLTHTQRATLQVQEKLGAAAAAAEAATAQAEAALAQAEASAAGAQAAQEQLHQVSLGAGQVRG